MSALLLVDGPYAIPQAQWRLAVKNPLLPAPPEQSPVIRGDALIPAISAASILAKSKRDKLMRVLDRRWPGYGFAGHKGYATPEHRRALAALGLCPQHRPSFIHTESAAWLPLC